MLKRTITGVLLAALVLACIWFQGYFVIVPLTIAGVICIQEMLTTLKKGGKKPVEWPAYLYMLGTGIAQALAYANGVDMITSMAINQVCLIIGIVVGFSAVIAKGKVDMEGAFATIIPIIYPGMFWSMIYPLNCIGGKMMTLIALGMCFFLANMNDLFALLAGMTFGKHKLSPNISPKKTIEGSIGGLVASLAFSLIIPYLLRGIMLLFPYSAAMVTHMPAWWQYALVGIPAGAASQFGDLAASMIKRQCGVKDFGSIFPGHGGIMDRMDGVFFATAVIYCFFMCVGV